VSDHMNRVELESVASLDGIAADARQRAAEYIAQRDRVALVGWVIDRDHLNSGDASSRVGWGQKAGDEGGFHSVTITRGLSASSVSDPVRFRVLDDDGEPYYGGAIARDWLDGDEELAFGPLAFAQADAGCTIMQYRNSAGEWETL
jgi:hypothetical protein